MKIDLNGLVLVLVVLYCCMAVWDFPSYQRENIIYEWNHPYTDR